MNLTVAENKDLASVFRRGMQGTELDDDEAIQYIAFLGQFLNAWTVLYDLHVEHHLPDTQWTVVRKDIITMLSTPGGLVFWNDVGKLGVHETFQNEVEKILASDEVSYTIV